MDICRIFASELKQKHKIMALTIKENNGIFKVESSLNATTAKNFQSHFETILNTYGELTLNIKHIESTDVYGANALKTLSNNALTYGRDFFSVANDCIGVYKEFKLTNAAA